MAVPSLSGWASVRLPWSRLQPPPLKFRTAGFPRYGLKFQAPRRSAESLPIAADGSSAIPTSTISPDSWLSPSGSPRPSASRSPASVCGPTASDDPTWTQRSSLRWVSHRPTLIAWRPHPPVWSPPGHFPARPVIGTVFDIRGSSCLATRPSELSLLGSPGLPPSTSAGRSDTGTAPSFRAGTGHRVEGRNSWHLRYSA